MTKYSVTNYIDYMAQKQSLTTSNDWMEKRFQLHLKKIKKLLDQCKKEIFSHIDPIIKELQTSREGQSIASHQINRHKEKLDDHEQRITYLEATPLSSS